MAIFEDKRKPVNIYEPGTPTARAQAVNNRIGPVAVGMRGAGLVADAVTTPARNIAQTMKSTIVDPVVDANQAQNSVLEKKAVGAALRKLPAGDMAGFREMENATSAAAGGTSPLQPSGMIPLHQEEQTNPAPVVNAAAGQAPGPGDTALSPIHARADSRIPPVAGGVPGGAFSVNLSPQDQQLKENLAKIDAMVAGGVVPTPEQAQQIQELKQQAGFLRGGTDRRPVGRDGMPIKTGGGAGMGGNYSIQGSPETVARFNSAVSPSEYSPEAQAARDKQHEQFLARNGMATPKLTELEQILGKPLDHFGAEVQPEIIKAAVGGMSAKGANEAAMANAKSNAEYRGGMLDAKGALLEAKMREMDLRGEMKDKEIAARGALKAQMSPADEANVHKAIAEISFGGINDSNVESINALRAKLGQPPLMKAKVGGKLQYVPSQSGAAPGQVDQKAVDSFFEEVIGKK